MGDRQLLSTSALALWQGGGVPCAVRVGRAGSPLTVAQKWGAAQQPVSAGPLTPWVEGCVPGQHEGMGPSSAILSKLELSYPNPILFIRKRTKSVFLFVCPPPPPPADPCEGCRLSPIVFAHPLDFTLSRSGLSLPRAEQNLKRWTDFSVQGNHCIWLKEARLKHP